MHRLLKEMVFFVSVVNWSILWQTQFIIAKHKVSMISLTGFSNNESFFEN